MTIGLLLFTAALYACGLVFAHRARRGIALSAAVAFALALATIAVAMIGPLDKLSEAYLSWHMVQHLVLVGVVAPLLLLAAPVRITLAAVSARHARRIARALNAAPLSWLGHPAIAWLQFMVVLYGTHLSPFYEAALENEGIHAVEHVLFLGSAVVFWMPLLAVAPAPHAPPHAVRILSIFLAIPITAFLGFTFYVARTALYAHYAKLPGALDDQMNAGAVMWIAGGMPLFIALLWTVADWGARERRYGELTEERR